MTSLENAWENAYGDRLLNIINQHFYSKLNELFNPPHPISSHLCENSYDIEIIKCIAKKYIVLRLRSHGKNKTLVIMGSRVTMRQKLRKTILFSNV